MRILAVYIDRYFFLFILNSYTLLLLLSIYARKENSGTHKESKQPVGDNLTSLQASYRQVFPAHQLFLTHQQELFSRQA